MCYCTAETPAHLPDRLAHEEARSRGYPPPDAWHRLSQEQKTAVTVWSRLSETTRHAIGPYLNLRAEPVVLEALAPSPVLDGAHRYSDWIIMWCRQLLTTVAAFKDAPDSPLTPAQLRRATLLSGTYPCIRHDAMLALSLLPPLIVLLLKAAPLSTPAGGGAFAGDAVAPSGYTVPRDTSAPPKPALLTRAQLVCNLMLEIDAVLLRATATSDADALLAEPSDGAMEEPSPSHPERRDAPEGGGEHAEHLLCCQA